MIKLRRQLRVHKIFLCAAFFLSPALISPSYASNSPEFRCYNDPHPDLFSTPPSGLVPRGYYVGDFLYRIGPDLGLVKRPFDETEILKRETSEAGEIYSNGVIRLEAGHLIMSDGTSFACELYENEASSAFTAANACMIDLGITDEGMEIGQTTDELDQILKALDSLAIGIEQNELDSIKEAVRNCVNQAH